MLPSACDSLPGSTAAEPSLGLLQPYLFVFPSVKRSQQGPQVGSSMLFNP